MPKAESELLVIDKMYSLMLWLDQRIESFPRRRQCTLGDRLDRRTNEILEGLLKAKYSTERIGILREVNMQLELLRFQLRAAKDQRCLSLTSYGFAARSVNEIGRLVGSWLKKAARGTTTVTTRAAAIATGGNPTTATTTSVFGCVVCFRQHSARGLSKPPLPGPIGLRIDGRAEVRVQTAVRRRSRRETARRGTGQIINPSREGS